jgi:hypothetical protein
LLVEEARLDGYTCGTFWPPFLLLQDIRCASLFVSFPDLFARI